MNDIVGIYTGLPEDAWYPNTIHVNMSNSEIDGIYTKFDAGGGGVVFLNENTDTILKVKFFSYDDDEEVIYQKKAGVIAPEIFYDSFREVSSDIAGKNAFKGDKVQVIIMEYLNPDEWVPLRSVRQLSDPRVQSQLLEIIYNFIFEMNLKNVADFVGNTGPHLFLNEISNQIKVVDYGLFKVSTNPPYDFLMMVKEIQDVVIRWPNEEVMECYKKIMDFSKEVTDEPCKGLVLYQGRLFLEGKLRPKEVTPPKQKISINYGPNKKIKKKNKKKNKKKKAGNSLKKATKRRSKKPKRKSINRRS